MNPLTCEFTETIRKDFSALWDCHQRGNSLEISTPYLLPDSSLLTIFLTAREGRYIITDGGAVSEAVREYSALPLEEIKMSMKSFADKFRVKSCPSVEGKTVFYKDTEDFGSISSMCFDVANFAVFLSSSLIAVSDSEEIPSPRDQKFFVQADSYIREVLPPSIDFAPRSELKELPGVRFSAVIKGGNKLCLVSYITGSTITYFRKTVGEAAQCFRLAHKSKLHGIIRTIPLLDDDAEGYRSKTLAPHLRDLSSQAEQPIITWRERDELRQAITSSGVVRA